MSSPLASLQPIDVVIEDHLLKKTFLDHLNYIFFGKQHLITFFHEIKEIATLKVLKMAIQEAIDDAGNQLVQMEGIYNTIAKTPAQTSTLSLRATTLEAYLAAIKAGKSPLERDVSILFYLQQIEGIEVIYFKVLKNLSKAIGYSDDFIDQPFDIAVENKILFESIYKEYIS
jgi:ferritin-like metal-binding protein YciE